MSHGVLEVIVGCMSSGKSEELLRRLKRAEIAKQSVIVFKPQTDTRTTTTIASRTGGSRAAHIVPSSGDILSLVQSEHVVIGIDEAQFFDADICSVAEQLVRDGKRVIAVGLDTDFRGQPFGPIPTLLALADHVTKLNAVCMQCGGVATRTYILKKPETLADVPGSPIAVGGDELYEARCRDCFSLKSSILDD